MSENETLENKRKRLIFRSEHRGMKEMDIIMGAFARKNIPTFSEEELDLYEDVIQIPDVDLYNWISGKEEPPANDANPVLKQLLAFKLS